MVSAPANLPRARTRSGMDPRFAVYVGHLAQSPAAVRSHSRFQIRGPHRGTTLRERRPDVKRRHGIAPRAQRTSRDCRSPLALVLLISSGLMIRTSAGDQEVACRDSRSPTGVNDACLHTGGAVPDPERVIRMHERDPQKAGRKFQASYPSGSANSITMDGRRTTDPISCGRHVYSGSPDSTPPPV